MERAGVSLRAPVPQADTATLRRDFAALLDARRAALVRRWCDWADVVLSDVRSDRESDGAVVLHGDVHGFNVLADDDLRIVRVLDFEEASLGDFHYDLRYLPAQEPTTELLTLTAAAYGEATGRAVSTARVMAWHLRTVCGDALWRTVAGAPHFDGWTAGGAVDDVAARFSALGIAVHWP